MSETQTSVETPATPVETALEPDQQVSIEIGDRVLTGVGETEAELRAGLTEAKPDKPARGKKRIDELTWERAEAQRKADAAEARAADLEARLKALEQKPAASAPVATAPSPAVAPPKAAPSAPTATRQKPSEDQVGSVYQTYADFVEDLADWKAEQRLAGLDLDARVRRSIEADQASRTAADRESKSIDRGRQAYPDFDAVMRAPHFYDGQWPAFVRAAIADLDAPEHVYYQLGKDPALAQRIRTLDPVRLGMELARLTGSAVAPSASTAAPVVSLPPPPMQPVGSGSKTTALSPSDLAERGSDDYDSSGFREALRASRRR